MSDFTVIPLDEFRRRRTTERDPRIVAILVPRAKVLGRHQRAAPARPGHAHARPLGRVDRLDKQWKREERVDRVTLRSLFNKLSAGNIATVLPKILATVALEAEPGPPVRVMFQYCGMSAEYVPLYVTVCKALCADRDGAAYREIREYSHRFMALEPWALEPVEEVSDYDAFCEYLKVKNARVNVARALLLSGLADGAGDMADECVAVLADPNSKLCKDLAVRLLDLLVETRPSCVAAEAIGRLRTCERDVGAHGIKSMIKFKIQALLKHVRGAARRMTSK